MIFFEFLCPKTKRKIFLLKFLKAKFPNWILDHNQSWNYQKNPFIAEKYREYLEDLSRFLSLQIPDFTVGLSWSYIDSNSEPCLIKNISLSNHPNYFNFSNRRKQPGLGLQHQKKLREFFSEKPQKYQNSEFSLETLWWTWIKRDGEKVFQVRKKYFDVSPI